VGTASTALEAWNKTPANMKHPGDDNPPVNAPVYWGGGQGHVALSDGQGGVWSTDILRPGKVDNVPLNQITLQWGKPYLGWAEGEPGGTSVATGHGSGQHPGGSLNPLNWFGDFADWAKAGALRAGFFIIGTLLILFFLWREASKA